MSCPRRLQPGWDGARHTGHGSATSAAVFWEPKHPLLFPAGGGEVIDGVPSAGSEPSSRCFSQIHGTGRGGHRVAGLLTLPAY